MTYELEKIEFELKNMSLRMSAYYYSFYETGVKPIDLILSSVAWAGKCYHLTQEWNEKESPPEQLSGETPVEWIQNAAIAAAEELVKTKKLYEKEKGKVINITMFVFKLLEKVNQEQNYHEMISHTRSTTTVISTKKEQLEMILQKMQELEGG